MKSFIETFIKTITMLTLIGLMIPSPSWSETPSETASTRTQVPDTVITDLQFITVDPHSVLIALKFHPTEDVMRNPPKFVFEYGEEQSIYYMTIPMYFDNAIDEEGNITTNLISLSGLKIDTVYHYHIKMIYLGVLFDTNDDMFKTASSL
jgi:hypothetical protein